MHKKMSSQSLRISSGSPSLYYNWKRFKGNEDHQCKRQPYMTKDWVDWHFSTWKWDYGWWWKYDRGLILNGMESLSTNLEFPISLGVTRPGVIKWGCLDPDSKDIEGSDLSCKAKQYWGGHWQRMVQMQKIYIEIKGELISMSTRQWLWIAK